MKVNLLIPAGLPPVRAHQRKLAQVMLNLLVNAGEALEELRTLKPEVTIQAIREGESMRVTVTDNGPGIPAAVMPRMFEPFFTTKPPGKGTGLGLALSREYVEAFGGTLSVSNVQPHGAQFSIVMRVTSMTGETPLPGSLDLGPQRQALLDRHRRKAS
jgi:C4-dicarboxylate-specific signal transduction histidine kinase